MQINRNSENPHIGKVFQRFVRTQLEIVFGTSFDVHDTARGLEIAKHIRGLGTAGASGLLAILSVATLLWNSRSVCRQGTE